MKGIEMSISYNGHILKNYKFLFNNNLNIFKDLDPMFADLESYKLTWGDEKESEQIKEYIKNYSVNIDFENVLVFDVASLTEIKENILKEVSKISDQIDLLKENIIHAITSEQIDEVEFKICEKENDIKEYMNYEDEVEKYIHVLQAVSEKDFGFEVEPAHLVIIKE